MNLPKEGSLSDKAGVAAEEQALRELPWRYAKVEDLALNKLEAMFSARDAIAGL
jgi:hypothetical protein